MSVLLRSLSVLGVASLLMVGCGEKEAAAPAEVAPVAAPVEAASVEAAPVAGGYEPTAEERVPGITIDPATLAAQAAAAAEPAEAVAE
ncbi:MAG: hypothetical protein A3I83_03955 [Methylotenera sp. RIFCSPLOWO2_02_FULL_45_14]|nr:MAG: hypothetical protein A3I83_03955 [Methylotenera sp. RIFCSPLOWO2_02_FULL_45_14]